VENNKAADIDWFRLESNKEGTRWFGKCWYIHELLKYEFDVEFDVRFCDLLALITAASLQPTHTHILHLYCGNGCVIAAHTHTYTTSVLC